VSLAASRGEAAGVSWTPPVLSRDATMGATITTKRLFDNRRRDAHRRTAVPLLATVLGICGIVTSLSMAVPQSVLIWRHRSRVGVSVATWALFSMSFSTWIGYSLRVGNHVVLASNVLSLITAATLLVGTLRADGWPRRRSVVAPLLMSAVWILLAIHGNRSPVVAVAPVLLAGSAVRIPQIVASARSAAAGVVSDVSLVTWWVSFVSGWFWLGHALLVGDVLVALSGAVVLVTSGAVVALEGVAARRAAAAVPIS
jgi:uncharacterized protein with PQ loop repeat